MVNSERRYRPIILSITVLLALAACSAEPTTAELQTLADAACECTKSAKGKSNYNPDKPSSCWRDFDATLKRSKWAFMSAAADGPMSSAGICTGMPDATGNDPDLCPDTKIVWVSRSLGACSAAEEAERQKRFRECLDQKRSDEIACANFL